MKSLATAIRVENNGFTALIILVGSASVVTAGMLTEFWGFLAVFVVNCVVFSLITIYLVISKMELSMLLMIPIFLSAFQNVFLAPISLFLESGELMTIIVLNWVYALIMLAVLVAFHGYSAKQTNQRSLGRTALIVMTVVCVYGLFVTVWVNYQLEPNLIAIFASLRNLTSPFLFFAIGWYASAQLDVQRFFKIFLYLGFIVILAAVVEYGLPNFWQSMGLHNLWRLKGIPVQSTSLLPLNFYASEQIYEGQFIRRMAGPFADPVNFGTFLFALLCVAWLTRSWWVFVMALVAIVLVVSKGALLGMLSFLTIWGKRFRSSFVFYFLLILTISAGIWFYGFTIESSTGSAQVHVIGFVSGMVSLWSTPLGNGIGNGGVLASLFTGESASPVGIRESGLGVVFGQLGVPGLMLYLTFFVILISSVFKIKDSRRFVTAMSLLIAFVLNSMFNEVAFSPNSSAIYFLCLGVLVADSGIQVRAKAGLSGESYRREIRLMADSSQDK